MTMDSAGRVPPSLVQETTAGGTASTTQRKVISRPGTADTLAGTIVTSGGPVCTSLFKEEDFTLHHPKPQTFYDDCESSLDLSNAVGSYTRVGSGVLSIQGRELGSFRQKHESRV